MENAGQKHRPHIEVGKDVDKEEEEEEDRDGILSGRKTKHATAYLFGCLDRTCY